MAENKRSVTQVLSFRVHPYAICGVSETNLLTTGCF